MKVSIIGSGRVGLSFGAVLAQSGFEVFMTDKDLEKKQSVMEGILPFYEPGLEDCIKKYQNQMLWTRYTEKLVSADFIFLCLSTPVKQSGDMELTEVLKWAELIAKNAAAEKFLVIKSTFPIGTNKKIQDVVSKAKVEIPVITCPEFLRQGQALKDLAFPERLVIGSRDIGVGKKLEELYKKFSHPKEIIHTDPETAELSKLACNSFLAVKISFINEFSGLCEQIKGDVRQLQQILGSDSRIGKDFLNPGLGYGGYCLPKDVQLSIQEGEKRNQSMNLLKSAKKINDSLTKAFFQKIMERYKSLKNVPLAFWGISFKKNTDDLKNSPALDLLCRLLKAGAELHVYDPLFVKKKVSVFFDKKTSQSSSNFTLKTFFKGSFFQEDHIAFLRRKIFSGKVLFYKTALESLDNRQGLIVGSDWEEFCQIPLSEVKKKLSQPFLVDGRNLFSIKDLQQEGFSFYQRGFSFIQKKIQS